MPSKDAIIGRVAVKVLPDTEDFRKDTERQLSVIEKALGPIKVQAKLDTTGLNREVIEAIRDMNQRNREDSRKITFRTKISTVGMRGAVNEAARELNALAKDKQIDFKVGDLGVQGGVAIVVDEDALDDARDRLNRWRDSVSPLEIALQPDVSSAASALASARLALLTRPRTVSIIPEVNSPALAAAATSIAALSGARFLSTYFDDMARALGRLDESVPVLGSLALAMAGLAGFGITAVSNLFALISSLAQIGPAALALPGIVGGVGIGVGVMVAALKDFNSVFPDVKQSFADMQNLISANFWAEAEGSMRRMIDQLLPQLSAGFGTTATALGGYFSGIADGIRNTLSGALGGMFADLATSIQIATGGTGALVGIITTLGTVGAGYLPRLATFFVDITTQFNNFLAGAAADGRLQGWIDTAIEGLKDLGSILFNAGAIIMSIGEAASAAGGSGLSILADTMQRVADIVSGPAFQTQLIAVFEAAHRAIGLITSQSGPAFTGLFEQIGNLLTTILPIAGAAIGELLAAVGTALANPALSVGIITVFAAIKDAVTTLAPAFLPISEAIAALLPVVAALIEAMAPIATVIFVALSQALVDIAPLLLQLIDFLGTQLLNAVNVLAPVITGLTGFLSEHTTIAGILAGIIGTVVVAAYVLMATQAAISAAASVIAWLTIATSSTAASNGVKLSVGQIIVHWLFLAAQSMVHAIQVAAAWLVTQAAAVQAVAVMAVQKALFVAHWIAMGIASVAQGAIIAAVWTGSIIAQAVAATAAVVAQIAIQIASWVLMGVQSLLAAAKVAAAWLIAMGPIGLVIAAVVGLVALIILNWDTIKAKTIELWNKVKDATSAAWEAVKGFVKKGIDFLVSLFMNFTGPGLIIKHWETIKAATSAAWEAMKQVVGDGVDGVVNFIKSIPGKITAVFSNAGSILRDAGVRIVRGLLDGIESMIGSVKDKLASLTNLIPDWKGPAPRDKILLVDAGKLIIGGLIDGMESQYDGVRKSLQGLGNDIGSTMLGSPTMADLATPQGAGSIGLASAVAASESEGVTKVFNYYAAPGSSLSSEEELFAASDRSRMVGW